MRRLLGRLAPAHWALAGILLAGLGLRLWSIDHGLPYVFNADEELHFASVAVEMIARGSLDPDYFENPPALTYLLMLAFKLRYTAGFPFGGGGDFVRAFEHDPESAYVLARTIVALIGTLVAGLAYWAGTRFYDRRVGLIAAALLAFAFLPVFYSKQALNDVVTLAPLTVGLVGCLLAWRRGRWVDWLLAGGALGVACATKYTAGAAVVCVAVAALARVLEDRAELRRAALGVVAAAALFTAAFVLLNPYAIADLGEFRSQLGGQSAQASGAKLGQEDVPGWLYYLWTLTWGFGWLPFAAALAGGVLAVRADRWRGLLLVAFPIVLFLFLGAQGRFFGRWLLPAYPALAVLAGYAAVRAVDAVRLPGAARPAVWRPALAVLAGVLLVAQGVAASTRVSAVLERTDTRVLARDWLVANVPSGARIVHEPFIPRGFLGRGGRDGPPLYERFPIKRPFQAYERRLSPALVERYRAERYCWVVVGSHQKGRGLKEGLPQARAYYDRLAAESELVFVASPYEPGAEPVEFNFDFSFDYYPRAFLRPGPVVEVFRLRDCEPSRT
jgi:hypothetical protein